MQGKDAASAIREPNNLRGILLMTGGFASFSCADIIAKFLTTDFHPVQIVWTRQLGIFLGVFVLILMYGPSLLKSASPALQISRGFFAIGSATCFVFAISYVPLADAVAVSFVAPFMVTILGAMILREPVGIRRWMAVLAGFAGTLVVIRPGFGVFHPAIFLVVFAAAFFAGRQIISRYMGNKDKTSTTLAYTSITSLVVLVIPLTMVWRSPQDAMTILLMTGLAAFAGFGEFLFIKALETAHAVVVAPMQYTLIIFSTFWGYIVFAQLPDLWTWAGAAIIMGSGLYTLYRETRVSRRQPLSRPT